MKKNSIISLVELLNDEYAVGNAEGRAVFQKLAQHIDNNPAQVVFGISLKGVKFTDASFPRESVISIAKLYRAEKGFYLTDFLDKDLIDNWDYAAKAKEQPLIIWDGGRFTLIGPNINNSVRELLEYVNKQGEVTTSKVAAEIFRRKMPVVSLRRCSNRGLYWVQSKWLSQGGTSLCTGLLNKSHKTACVNQNMSLLCPAMPKGHF